MPSDYESKQILILVNRLNRHFFLIINKSEKVGFIDLEIQAEDNAYFSFYIKSDKRGQGLGGLAVKKLIEISKGLGVRKLIGEVNPSNKNSQKVLFKEGFIEEKRDKNGYTEFCISLN